MITGIDRPSSGAVVIDGTPVHKLNENQLAVWRGKTIGVVFQFFQLLPTLTVAENVMLPMDFCNVYTPAERPERALHLLEQVEMADQADKLPSALSGGQQQRVAIARALANDPPILAADEPTGNLDSKTADSVFSLFERLVDDGKTIIMVTHDTDIAARVRRSLHVSDGEIVEERLNELNAALAEEPELVRAAPAALAQGHPRPDVAQAAHAARRAVDRRGHLRDRRRHGRPRRPDARVRHRLPVVGGALGGVLHDRLRRLARALGREPRATCAPPRGGRQLIARYSVESPPTTSTAGWSDDADSGRCPTSASIEVAKISREEVDFVAARSGRDRA